ncbi:MAG: amidohydrolase [Pirellulales bacterium]
MRLIRCLALASASLSLVLSLGLSSVSAQTNPAVPKWLDGNLEQLVRDYQWLHTHPEVSFEEAETAKFMSEQWRKAGYEVTAGVGKHGVVAVLKNGQGPTVMLRTDLDALPVTEQTGVPYESKATVVTESGTTSGVMHACGHDIHMTSLIGAARFLAAHKDLWRGTLVLIGQPAEERGSGAKAMLDDGLFTRFPKPDFAVALHVESATTTGKIAVRSGYSLANVDSVDITVAGRGGHGAAPDTTVDPIVQAAELIMSLQTIVSREIKPIEPAVVTVGSIHGGTKHNIIGDSCHLQLTVRSYSQTVREKILASIKRRALAVAQAYGAPEPTIKVSEGTPALENHKELTERLIGVMRKTIGEANVLDMEPVMGGEDFSQYGLAGVPICMIRLGAVSAERLERYKQLGQTPPSLHSPFFYPDADQALATGVTTLTATVFDLMKPSKP